MAYTLKRVRTFTWPAHCGVPVDGGNYDEVEITLRFRAIPQSELEETAAECAAVLEKIRARKVYDKLLDASRRDDSQKTPTAVPDPTEEELALIERWGINPGDTANILFLKVVTESIEDGIQFENDDGSITQGREQIKAQAFDYLFILQAIDQAWMEAQTGYERKN